MQLLPQEHSFDEPLGLLSDCHRRVERFLTILHKVALEAPPSTQLPPRYREGLASALDYFRHAAPKHTADEEESLFPRIRQNEKAAEIISRLESEHQESEPLHQTVEELGRAWLATGALPAPQREAFQTSVEALLALYKSHIAVEDQELFPLAAQLLDEDSLHQIGREMAGRRGLEAKEPKRR